MKISFLYKKILERLSNITNEEKEKKLETEIILSNLFNVNRIDILTDKNIEVSNAQLERIEDILLKREKRIPIQYIFNKQEFRNYEFYVDERVLIPRPETEILIDVIINLCKKNYKSDELIRIVDIGCGSGNISISLALEIKNSLVYGVDISKDALEVAKINKNNLNVKNEKLNFIHSDKFNFFNSNDEKFNILVSNPPYIPKEEYLHLEAEVLNNEPKQALLGFDEDGLGFYRYFADIAKNVILNDGFLCFELGHKQAEQVADILKLKNIFCEIEIIKDYSNINRIIVAKIGK